MKKQFDPQPAFQRAVRPIFEPFATEYGLLFEEVGQGSFRLSSRYSSVEIVLGAGHTPSINVTVSPMGTNAPLKFGVGLVAKYLGNECNLATAPISKPEDVRQVLLKWVLALKENCGGIIRGTFCDWNALRALAQKQAREMKQKWTDQEMEWRFRDWRERADVAFTSHEYSIAAEYYEKLGDNLRPYEQGRLRFAKKKIRKSE